MAFAKKVAEKGGLDPTGATVISGNKSGGRLSSLDPIAGAGTNVAKKVTQPPQEAIDSIIKDPPSAAVDPLDVTGGQLAEIVDPKKVAKKVTQSPQEAIKSIINDPLSAAVDPLDVTGGQLAKIVDPIGIGDKTNLAKIAADKQTETAPAPTETAPAEAAPAGATGIRRRKRERGASATLLSAGQRKRQGEVLG